MTEQTDKEITEMLFAAFWKAFPKKEGKKPTWDKFCQRDIATQRLIVSHVQERATTDAKWLGGFCPMGTTFMNQERWNDEYEVADSRTGKSRSKKQSIEIIICKKCKTDTRTQHHADICEFGVPYYDVKIGNNYYVHTGAGPVMVK